MSSDQAGATGANPRWITPGFAILALAVVFLVVQTLRLQDRLRRLETAAGRTSVAPPDPGLAARLAALEKAFEGIPSAPAPRPPSPAYAPLTDPVAGSPAFQEGVRKVYVRLKDEERANDIVLTRKVTFPHLVDDLHLDPAQAEAMKPFMDEQAARIDDYFKQILADPSQITGPGLLPGGRPGDGSLRAVVWQKDVELRRAAYARIKNLLKPSQGVAAKEWIEWRFDRREKEILERWERMARNQESPELRPIFEDAVRQLHEESDQNEGNAFAFSRLQSRERQVRAALLERLGTRVTENELGAFTRYFGQLDRLGETTDR